MLSLTVISIKACFMYVGFILYFGHWILLQMLLHRYCVSDQNIQFSVSRCKLESSVGQTLILYRILKVSILLSLIATFSDTNTSQTQISFSSCEVVLQVLKQILRAFWVTDLSSSFFFFFKLKLLQYYSQQIAAKNDKIHY